MKSFTTAIILSAVAATTASADIVIDAFTDAFESEEFVSSAGSHINSVFNRAGLEVGNLGVTNGALVGDVWGGFVPRTQEIQHQLGLAGVLGGSRYGELNASTPTLGSEVSVATFNGLLAYSTAFGTQAILDLNYNANGAGLNLNAASQTSINIDLIGGDLDASNPGRPVPFSITLTSGLGTGSQTSVSLSNIFFSPDTYSIDLANYANLGIDLTDIDAVHLNIDQSGAGLAAVDFVIGQIAIVPAPGTAGLFVLAGITATRRRR